MAHRRNIRCVRISTLNAVDSSIIAKGTPRNCTGDFSAESAIGELVARLTLGACDGADAASAVFRALHYASDSILICKSEALEAFDTIEQAVSP